MAAPGMGPGRPLFPPARSLEPRAWSPDFLPSTLSSQPSARSAYEPLALLRGHRHGGPAAQPQHDRQQPGEREHPGLQAQQDRVPGFALPEAARLGLRLRWRQHHPHRHPEIGNGARVAATSKIFTQGQLTNSGEKLDVALQGDGFFEVQETRRHDRLHARRLLQDQRPGPGPRDHRRHAGAQRASSRSPPAPARSESRRTAASRSRPPAARRTSRLTLSRFANPAGGLRSIGGNLYEDRRLRRPPESRRPGVSRASPEPCRATSRPRTSTSSRKW